MSKLATVLMVVALVPACKKKETKPADPAVDPKTGVAKTTDTPADKPAEPKALTPEQMGARYAECLGFWSAKDEAKFKTCIAPDAVTEMVDSGMPAANGPDGAVATAKAFWTGFPDVKVEPQLTLVSGRMIVSVDWVHGTHTGEFMGVPASNKKLGMLILHALTVTETGVATKIASYMDGATLMGQIGANPAPHRAALEKGIVDKQVVVIGKDTKEEQANLAVAKAGVDGVNAHNVEALTASISDDSMESDQTAPADLKGKAELGKHVTGFFTAFPDVKLTVDQSMAAGDYVVNAGTFTGTNTGDMPAWGLKKTGKAVNVKYVEVMKVVGGKVTETWRFWNGMAMAMQLGLVPPPGAKDAAKPAEPPATK